MPIPRKEVPTLTAIRQAVIRVQRERVRALATRDAGGGKLPLGAQIDQLTEYREAVSELLYLLDRRIIAQRIHVEHTASDPVVVG